MSNHGTHETHDEAAHFVKLIISQDQSVHKWIQFLVAIEAGLAVGLGFVIRLPSSEAQNHLPIIVILPILVMGIATAIALSLLIQRERRWTAWYVRRFNALSGREGRVFPAEPGVISKLPGGFTSRVVFGVAVLVVLAWLLVGGYILWTGEQLDPPQQPTSEATASQAPQKGPGEADADTSVSARFSTGEIAILTSALALVLSGVSAYAVFRRTELETTKMYQSINSRVFKHYEEIGALTPYGKNRDSDPQSLRMRQLLLQRFNRFKHSTWPSQVQDHRRFREATMGKSLAQFYDILLDNGAGPDEAAKAIRVFVAIKEKEPYYRAEFWEKYFSGYDWTMPAQCGEARSNGV